MQIDIHDLLDSYTPKETHLDCEAGFDSAAVCERVKKDLTYKKRGISVIKSKKLIILVAAIVLLMVASVTAVAAADGNIINKVKVFFTGENGEMMEKSATLKSVEGEGDSKQYIFTFDDEDENEKEDTDEKSAESTEKE